MRNVKRSEALSRREILKMTLSSGAFALLPQLPGIGSSPVSGQPIIPTAPEPVDLAARTAARPILIVDDSPELVILVMLVLRRVGNLSVIGLTHSDDVSKICREQPVSLIMSDLMRPECDGLDMMARLRADERTRHIPCMIHSCCAALPRFVGRAVALGITDLYTKPLAVQELITAVEQILLANWPLPAVPGMPATFDPGYIAANWPYYQSGNLWDIYKSQWGKVYLPQPLRSA